MGSAEPFEIKNRKKFVPSFFLSFLLSFLLLFEKGKKKEQRTKNNNSSLVGSIEEESISPAFDRINLRRRDSFSPDGIIRNRGSIQFYIHRYFESFITCRELINNSSPKVASRPSPSDVWFRYEEERRGGNKGGKNTRVMRFLFRLYKISLSVYR